MTKPEMSCDDTYDLPYIKIKNRYAKLIFFFISMMINAWCMFYVVLFGFVLSPLRFINVRVYQKLESYAWIHGAKLYTFMCNLLVGVPTRVYGDFKGGFSQGKKIVLSNHCSSADWLIQLEFAGRNSDGALRFFLKKAHKYVPVAGWACQLHDMIFVTRDLKIDKPYMKKKLTSFIENGTDNMLVLYPEGTFTTSQNKWLVEKSHKWSKEKNLPIFNNVLFPRAQGFSLVMETKEAFDYIVDVTIAFEKPYCGKLGEFDPPLLEQFFYPRCDDDKNEIKLHINYKRYEMKDIPQDTDKWLIELFEEKDKLLEYFNEHQKFPGESYIYRDSFWDLFMNFLFGWFVEGVTGYYMYHYIPWLLYTFATVSFLSAIFLLVYDRHHQKNKERKSKRTEDEKNK